jgi:hypothetical protein
LHPWCYGAQMTNFLSVSFCLFCFCGLSLSLPSLSNGVQMNEQVDVPMHLNLYIDLVDGSVSSPSHSFIVWIHQNWLLKAQSKCQQTKIFFLSYLILTIFFPTFPDSTW